MGHNLLNHFLLHLSYNIEKLHENIVKAITTNAVIPAAVVTTCGFDAEQITPTSKAKIIVKIINIGKPYFRVKSWQQPITIENTIKPTESMMMAAVEPKVLRNDSEFIAHTHINVVIINWMLNKV